MNKRMISHIIKLWEQRHQENMTHLPYRVRIVIGGIVGSLPGTGKLLEGQIANQITAGIKSALSTEFDQLGIQASYLDAKLLSTRSRKRTWQGDQKTRTFIDIRVLLIYFIQNQENLLAEKVVGKRISGFMKPLLSLGRPILKSQVDRLIEEEIHNQLCLLLPQEVQTGLQQMGFDILEVDVRQR